MRTIDRARRSARMLLALLLASLSVVTLAGALAGPARWRGEIDAFAAHDRREPPSAHGALFVGSSSIRKRQSLARDFPGVPVINRGFGGSTIPDATYYADRIVVPYRPRLIVMYAGDNDIAEGRSPQQVAGDFRAFVARVRRDLPGVPVAYVSIKPSPARWALWPRMREANTLIRDWAATQRDVRFVDVASPMLGAEGRPRAALFGEDGLHMNGAGYAVWTKALEPVLAAYGFEVRRAASAR